MVRPVVAAAVAVLVLVWSGCGNVRLVEPVGGDVALAGAHLSLDVTDAANGGALAFHGYFYGYRERDGQLYLRYLDAGTMRVAGREAVRRDLRAGEPEYALEASLEAVSDRVEVVVGGSEAVAPCTVSLRLPLVARDGGVIHVAAGEALSFPLDFVGGSGVGGQRLTAVIRLTGGYEYGATTTLSLETAVHGDTLTIPASMLATLPAGLAVMDLGLEWEQPVRRGAAAVCAPVVTVRTAYQVRRTLRLE